MSDGPVASVVVPTRNRADLVQETIASVQRQMFTRWELIVVDDMSTDRTEEVVRKLSRGDHRINYRSAASSVRGANARRNEGLSAARGRYVVFLDSDDLLAPWSLRERVTTMRQDESLDFAVFAGELFCEEPGDASVLFNVPRDMDDLDRLLFEDHPWQTCAVIWDVAYLKELGGWNEALPSWQDWEIHVRALAAGAAYRRVWLIDHYLRTYREDGHVSTAQKRNPLHLEAAESLMIDTSRLLDEAGLLDPRRRRAVAGLMERLAEHWWQEAESWANAVRCWITAFRHGVVPLRIFWEGAALLLLAGVPRLRWTLRSGLVSRWRVDRGLELDYRPFAQVPVSAAEGVTQRPPDVKPALGE